MASFRLACCAVAWVGALGCGAVTTPEQVHAGVLSTEQAEVGDPPAPQNLELNFLFVHGVQNCDSNRQNAESSLRDLETSITGGIPARVAAYEAAHPGVTFTLRTARANLYTATPSGIHPSNSTDPTKMDDWQVGDPGCASKRQGDPCTAAYEWRYRLAQEIHRLFPADARNIIIIAHSSGARAALEVAANTGPDGVGTEDWGVQERIAGVVTVHGVIDALGSSRYNVQGPFSFSFMCKDTDLVLKVLGQGCTPGNGWCEYAGDVSATASADWVAQHKRALMLVASGSCSPSLFTQVTDGTLPIDAQASPFAVGMHMTPIGGRTYRPAHGTVYGSFCHSDITGGPRHGAAVSAAQGQILDWLFASAPRVSAWGTVNQGALSYNHATAELAVGGACPTGEADGSVAVAGVCRHPGWFDGDDHPISSSELSVQNGASCRGSFHWTQHHDTSHSHAAILTWKTTSVLPGGGLVSALH